MNEIFFEILKLIVMVGVGFAVGVWRTAKTKYADEFDVFSGWVESAVLWAQQMYWSETGQARKGVVMEFLKTLRNKHKFNLTDEQIEVLVEAAVRQMNDMDGVGYIEVEDGDD